MGGERQWCQLTGAPMCPIYAIDMRGIGAFYTNDDADFTALVVEAAGHHGADGVVDHSHDVSVIVL